MGALLSAGWTPPLEYGQLSRIAERLRSLRSLEAILDDAGDVLSGQDPPEEEFANLGERLRDDLTRLADIAVAATEPDPGVASLTDRARSLTAAELPYGRRLALTHLRRMAGTVQELLEQLARVGAVRDIA
ncbi:MULTISPECIES: DUF6415 family natural product biosynthesis protein [Streptomyces]|uniref:DUF6415 family natural product biosynthesis protein n=1 Tax=Streptomyces TaxID=1883 RepID=UPI0005DD036D|nr:DUF6415 family natural product biosynthesis protein [Streptomyces sp. EAG2]KIX80007.1 hypothetical protein SF12_00565 [Streptomyces sp. MBRL 601]PKR41329.1 hypothetical protein CWE27_31865 [Streptomyces sp. EAG2]